MATNGESAGSVLSLEQDWSPAAGRVHGGDERDDDDAEPDEPVAETDVRRPVCNEDATGTTTSADTRAPCDWTRAHAARVSEKGHEIHAGNTRSRRELPEQAC